MVIFKSISRGAFNFLDCSKIGDFLFHTQGIQYRSTGKSANSTNERPKTDTCSSCLFPPKTRTGHGPLAVDRHRAAEQLDAPGLLHPLDAHLPEVPESWQEARVCDRRHEAAESPQTYSRDQIRRALPRPHHQGCCGAGEGRGGEGREPGPRCFPSLEPGASISYPCR